MIWALQGGPRMISSSCIKLGFCPAVELEALYGNLNLYGNFCYLVTWTQPLQAEIQITK